MVVHVALPLTSCGMLFDKDNTPEPKPLVNFTPQVTPQLLWSTRTSFGTGEEYLKVSPAISGRSIYTASTKGVVTSTDKITGAKNWSVDTGMPVTSGPGVGEGIVVVGTRKGDVIALQQNTGQTMWTQSIRGEVIANPAVGHGKVIIKSINGSVRALSVQDGHQLWIINQVEPNLILRGASKPLIVDNDSIIGFANGRLIRIGLYDGGLIWGQTIAVPEGSFAIQRMIDIDADPVVYGHKIFAATYQGKIASLAWSSGRTLWSHDLSSFTGMTADDSTVYVSDAKSHLWSFNADSGLVNWRQTKLEARNISGPAEMGRYIVVGDGQGYLHWIDKQDGHFAARVHAGEGIFASPIAENNVLYALTTNGYLMAYRLS